MKKILLILIMVTSGLFALNFDKAIAQVKKHEGFSKNMYRDMGHYSVGYGTNLSYITEPEAHMLLVHRLAIRYSKLQDLSWFRNLNANRQQIMLNMSYQVGHGGLLKFKKMIKALKKRHFKTAANEMKKSRWYRQSGARSKELVRLMRKG